MNTSKSQCSNQSFYECYVSKITKIFSNLTTFNYPKSCSNKCLPEFPLYLKSHGISECEKYSEDEICAMNFLKNNVETCEHSCSIIQYSGNVAEEFLGQWFLNFWNKFLPQFNKGI